MDHTAPAAEHADRATSSVLSLHPGAAIITGASVDSEGVLSGRAALSSFSGFSPCASCPRLQQETVTRMRIPLDVGEAAGSTARAAAATAAAGTSAAGVLVGADVTKAEAGAFAAPSASTTATAGPARSSSPHIDVHLRDSLGHEPLLLFRGRHEHGMPMWSVAVIAHLYRCRTANRNGLLLVLVDIPVLVRIIHMPTGRLSPRPRRRLSVRCPTLPIHRTEFVIPVFVRVIGTLPGDLRPRASPAAWSLTPTGSLILRNITIGVVLSSPLRIRVTIWCARFATVVGVTTVGGFVIGAVRLLDRLGVTTLVGLTTVVGVPAVVG
ncbi:hypothetical protein, partial [Streptomyces microflavus]|uniref:hypothetical protein n=1 Tax=Streptomyces microflavus TaxID=1919 RepID=UPI0036E82A10